MKLECKIVVGLESKNTAPLVSGHTKWIQYLWHSFLPKAWAMKLEKCLLHVMSLDVYQIDYTLLFLIFAFVSGSKVRHEGMPHSGVVYWTELRCN